MHGRLRSLSWALGLCLFALSSAPLLAQASQNRVVVLQEAGHALSQPLRQLAGKPLLPGHGRTLFLGVPPKAPIVGAIPDPVAQNISFSGPSVSTTNLLNFDGQSADGVAPPDTNGAVGSTQFVQTVNTTYSVYSKTTGSLVLGPISLPNIWANLGGLCSTSAGGDPVVLWDQLAQRWFISELSYNSNLSSNYLCMAVSTGSDATGTFNIYGFNMGTTLPDYPKYAVWPDAYYLSFNAFANSGTIFAGASPCALDRNAMLAGNAATMICFPPSPTNASFLPSDLDGNTAPPSGEPNSFVELATSTTLNLFKFHVDFTTPSKSTFTGPFPITVPSYTEICSGGANRACIPEPSPGEKLDSLGDRLMFRLAYRNFGTYEDMVVVHTVKPGSGSTATGATRWYELRATPPGGTFTGFQGGTVQHATISAWMGSVAMDKNGDIAVGLSASSSSFDPSVAYVGRVPTDPKGKMESPFLVIKGTGVQTSTFNRWGDYSSMSIDPSDDCTFWYTSEYYKTTGSFNWNTRIVSFKFKSCM